MLNFLSLLIALFQYAPSSGAQKPIAYRDVNQFTLIWNDKGSGADRDVSIWRPNDPQAGFYPLGDLAIATHSYPTNFGVVVKALESNALAPPASFTEIWRDSGSGADADVRIFRMNARWGYRCLGYVAIASYSQSPDRNKYRCVKSSYATYTGSYLPIWNDKGSGAHRDVAFFSNSEILSTNAIFTNTMTAVASHSRPSGKPYMLLQSSAIEASKLIAGDKKDIAIKVARGSDSNIIWKDSGSGADRDIFVYRPVGPATFFAVGDIAKGRSYKPSIILTIKAIKDDALRHPRDFRWIWNDRGSGAHWDGSFWEPICDSGYVSLGHVAVRSHGSPSNKNDFVCVNQKYVVTGKWEWVWNDRGSGARDDVSVYMAVPTSSNGQGLQAMGTVRCHCSISRPAYVLKSSAIQVINGKPVTKYIIENVRYLFNERNILSQSPETLQRTIVENQDYHHVLEAERQISYTVSTSKSWTQGFGLEVGVTVTASAGIPDLVEVSTSVSTTFSYTTSVGESIETSTSDTITAKPKVSPRSRVTVTIAAVRYVADIPYLATLISYHADGSRNIQRNYKGIYKGTSVTEIRVIYGENIPFS